MMMQSIGDLARGLVLERQTARLKADINRLTGELGSGRVADPARRLADTGPLAALGAAIARAEAHRAALGEIGRRAEIVQSVIGGLDTLAAPVRSAALALGPEPSPGKVALAADLARGRFADATALLNSRDGLRVVLAGAEGAGNALAPPAEILDALRTAIGPLVPMTAPAIVEAVRDWFDAPTGFAAAAWRGSATAAGPVAAAPGEAIGLDVNALDPAFRQTLEGLALAVLAGEAPDKGAALLGAAAARLGTAAETRALLAGRIGQTEARIEAAMLRHGAEASALSMRRNTMTEADPFATASALSALQDRIETVYAVTARLSRLSLADFLR